MTGLVFEETQEESGWFGSANTQELVFKAMLIKEDGSVEDQHSGIFLETEIFHGPVIFGMGDPDLPAVSFGAAITRSRVSFIEGDEAPVELPGGIYNRISYDGSGSLSVIFESFSEEFGNKAAADSATITWEGGRLDVDYDTGLSHVEFVGLIRPLIVVSDDGEFRLGEINFESSTDYSDFGIWIGNSTTSIEELTVVGSAAGLRKAFSLKGMIVSGSSRIDQGRLTGKVTLSIADLEMDDFADNTVQFSMSVDADAETIGRLKESMSGRMSADPEMSLAVAKNMQEVGMELLVRGLAFDISKLQINTAHGDARLVFQLEIPESELSGEAATMNALLSMSANSDLHISRSLFDYISQSNPLMAQQMMALLQTGMLIDQGEQLTMVAIYDGGLLTVNGMPIPLPVVPQ